MVEKKEEKKHPQLRREYLYETSESKNYHCKQRLKSIKLFLLNNIPRPKPTTNTDILVLLIQRSSSPHIATQVVDHQRYNTMGIVANLVNKGGSNISIFFGGGWYATFLMVQLLFFLLHSVVLRYDIKAWSRPRFEF
ncbi:hypothetical protein BC941DRAFT_424356 [Chlamydoabsidia padenii]|nr:hypothetical protein BC941DRAFT_424356 [Chlamydoabsidia padenii]